MNTNLKTFSTEQYVSTATIKKYTIPGVSTNTAVIRKTVVETNNSKAENVVIEKTTESKILKECIPIFVKDSFFEEIKTKTFHNIDIDAHQIENILEEDVSDKNLIWIYFGDYLFFNSNEVPIAIPQQFDYSGTPFNNRESNLTELLKYLKTHPWVLNKDELKIQSIPYYNCTETRYEWLGEIIILPDQDTYEKIFAQVKHEKYWSVRLKEQISGGRRFSTDWLGIKPFLKNNY